MTFYRHSWVADRINAYGWSLRGISGSKWSYHGKGLPYVVISVDERRVRGRSILVVEQRWVDIFDECVQDVFGETIYDGSEEAITFESEDEDP